MWPTVTIYTASASLTLLNTILNGVASICQQTDYIMGFAVMIAMFHAAKAPMTAAIHGMNGQGGGMLTQSVSGAVVSLLLGFALTNPSLQGTVQIESSINGQTSSVDHVPAVISIMPAAASLLSQDLGALVSTAFQNAGTNYSALSSQMNGFVNPLKALLGSRYVVQNLGQIDSEIKMISDSCIGTDSGADYPLVNQLVMNAGNSTGATTAQTVTINNVSGTALGALLYQAAQNTNGYVSDLDPNLTVVYSCPDAVAKVQTDISNDIQSPDFARDIQAATNGMDQPLVSADYSLNNLQNQYNALINSESVNTTYAYGAGQAQTELYNLMFSSLVESSLDCLRATSTDKAQCYATLEQAQQTERNNIQAAAAETPMLKYAGNLANYMLALIIGLGPVIVMFMMMAGVGAGKAAKTAVHIMVWPLLVTNIGAEIVNGMICVQLADFYTTLRQGGLITQATSYTAYSELSMQIGVASNLMASLPVLMSMIFGLSATAGLVSVADKNTPNFAESARELAPAPSVTRAHSMMAYDVGADGTVRTQTLGAQRMIATGDEVRNMQDANSAISHAQTRQQTISEAQTELSAWKQAMSSGDYSSFNMDKRTGDQISRAYNDALRVGTNIQTHQGDSSSRANTNTSNVGGQANGAIGIGTDGIHADIGATASAGTSTQATDGSESRISSSTDKSVNESKALTRALSQFLSTTRGSQVGHDTRQSLEKMQDVQQSYQKILSDTSTTTNSADLAVKQSSGLIAMADHVDANTLVNQLGTNAGFSAQQMSAGHAFEADPYNQGYLKQARDLANAQGATEKILGNARAGDAMIRWRAATMLASDQNADPAKRLGALKYLSNSVNALYGRQVLSSSMPKSPLQHPPLDAPTNQTGVDADSLKGKVDHGVPGAKPAAKHPGTHHHSRHREHHAPSSGNIPTSTTLDRDTVQVLQDAGGIVAERNREIAVNHNAGLGNDGPGTIIRTAENVKDNAKIRHGEPDRTHLGKPID